MALRRCNRHWTYTKLIVLPKIHTSCVIRSKTLEAYTRAYILNCFVFCARHRTKTIKKNSCTQKLLYVYRTHAEHIQSPFLQSREGKLHFFVERAHPLLYDVFRRQEKKIRKKPTSDYRSVLRQYVDVATHRPNTFSRNHTQRHRAHTLVLFKA